MDENVEIMRLSYYTAERLWLLFEQKLWSFLASHSVESEEGPAGADDGGVASDTGSGAGGVATETAAKPSSDSRKKFTIW